MGKSQQRKGRSGEAELTEILREYGYPVEIGKAESFGSVPDLSGLPGIHIECKRVERLNIWKAIEQAVRDVARFHDGLPAVFHRANRKPWLVTMQLDDFMKIYGKAQGNGDLQKHTDGILDGCERD